MLAPFAPRPRKVRLKARQIDLRFGIRWKTGDRRAQSAQKGEQEKVERRTLRGKIRHCWAGQQDCAWGKFTRPPEAGKPPERLTLRLQTAEIESQSCSVEKLATKTLANPENRGQARIAGRTNPPWAGKLRVQTPNSGTARNLVSVPKAQFEPVMRFSSFGCGIFSTERVSPQAAVSCERNEPSGDSPRDRQRWRRARKHRA